jgi:hypothetical protein
MKGNDMDHDCDPINTLCDLAEASDSSFQAIELHAQCGRALQIWAELGVIEPGAVIRCVTCCACDGDHPARVEFDTATRRHSYFCPDAGIVTVDDADLATLQFNSGRFLDLLIQVMPIAPPVLLRELVPDRAWYLGETTCGDSRITVIFACQVSSQVVLDRLASALRTVHPADRGLVITTSQNVTHHIDLPNRYEFLDIREIMRITAGGLTFDTIRLGSWIRGMSATTGKGAASRSGRPPEARITQIYRNRRSRKLPVVSALAEAKAIRKEMAKVAPDQKPPHLSTIRRYVAHLRREASLR